MTGNGRNPGTRLEPAPATPIVDGTPAFGTYRGACEHTGLEARDRGVGLYTRLLREKRWQWFSVADEAIAVGGAVVDAGPFGTVFCWVADRERGELIADASRLLPSPALTVSDRPTAGTVAGVRFGRRPLTVGRQDAAVSVRGSLRPVTLEIDLESLPSDTVTAICPVPGAHPGAVNLTLKELAGQARGTVVVDGDRHTITDGVGLLDYTHGILGRETRWTWGFCVGVNDGTPDGFNLVTDHNDGLENAVWIDGEPRTVGAATFARPGDADGKPGAWRVTTADGLVDATLSLESERHEDTTVGPFVSQYRQPLGRWSGRIGDREFDGYYGVAESHRAKW